MGNLFTDVPTQDINTDFIEVPSGLNEREIFYAPITDLSGTPELNAIENTATLDDIATFSGDVTFEADKSWKKLNLLVDTGEFTDDGTGPKGQKRSKAMFDFVLSGANAAILGFKRAYQNVPMAFLITQKGGGKILFGTRSNPAYISEAKLNSGKTQDDTVGLTCQVETNAQIGYYTGA